jgi:two-component sensor histidine kinase
MVGRSAEVIVTPEDRDAGVPRQEMEQASREGSAPDVRWHLCKDGRRVFIDGRTVALRHRNGSLRGFLKIGQDTTGRRRDEERQAVLLAELQHRVRNVLAMVRALVGRGRDTGSVAEFRAALDGRIAALARTQTLLTRHADDDGVDLEHLVRDEVTAQMDEAGRAALAGPAVTLSPKAAEVLSLAIHELATNATKHGAFAAKAGRVAVNWRVEARPPGPWLHLAWQESGVALEPGAPERMGFGTELITRRVPYELGGEGRIAFGPGGLRCEIAFPLLDGGSTLQTDAPVRLRGGGEA